MPMTLEEFIQAVEFEYNSSNPTWIANARSSLIYEVLTVSNRFGANATERAHIQNLGRAFGCHTCNRKIEHTITSYIVDHIPPKQIMGDGGINCRYRYFAHCDKCASKQSDLVRRCCEARTTQYRRYRDTVKSVGRTPNASDLTNAKGELRRLGMTDITQRKLLCGGRFKNSIPGRYGPPTQAERDQVNQIGRAHGCHSCGTKLPLSTYHADHCPPLEFGMTAWFPRLMEKLGHPMPLRWSFRPQCPDCSHKQGVRCRKLVDVALVHFLPGTGVVRYFY